MVRTISHGDHIMQSSKPAPRVDPQPRVVFELIASQGIWKISWHDAAFFSANLRRALTHAAAVFPVADVGETIRVTPSIDAALSARRSAAVSIDDDEVDAHAERICREVVMMDLPLGVDDLVVLTGLDAESVRDLLCSADPASVQNH